MNTLAWALIAGAALLLLYTYVGYPLFLWAFASPPRPLVPLGDEACPRVSICVPAYNEEAQIRGVIESLLALDYPAAKRQILVVSDASTDRTDGIVAAFQDRGVELLRLPRRSGKTAAENAAAPHLHGDFVVNTDASVRIRPDALRYLLAPFADPSVGVASGRDVSVAAVREDANSGESGYVGYEMEVRALETRVGGIVGASGSLYAIRPHLHREPLPEHLSRDFASALIAREHGYRAVSVDQAVCAVPRTQSLRREYRRKVRTMSRGMETLFFKRHLLNPLRHGRFAWMLLSHKVCRWLVPWAAAGAACGMALLATDQPWALAVLATCAAMCVVAVAGWMWPDTRRMPRVLAIPSFVVAGNVAAFHSLIKAMRGDENPMWEPTRREVVL